MSKILLVFGDLFVLVVSLSLSLPSAFFNLPLCVLFSPLRMLPHSTLCRPIRRPNVISIDKIPDARHAAFGSDCSYIYLYRVASLSNKRMISSLLKLSISKLTHFQPFSHYHYY